jgi:hypothetical protein
VLGVGEKKRETSQEEGDRAQQSRVAAMVMINLEPAPVIIYCIRIRKPGNSE